MYVRLWYHQSHPTLLIYNHPKPDQKPNNAIQATKYKMAKLRAEKKTNTLDITKQKQVKQNKQQKITKENEGEDPPPSHHAASAATTFHESPDSPDTAQRPAAAPQASY